MQQYSQPSSNQVVVQQQQMMPLQSQTNMMTPQMVLMPVNLTFSVSLFSAFKTFHSTRTAHEIVQ